MRTGELYQRYYGIYIARVIGVDDPDNLGRIRIECDQFQDTEDHPVWASVARPAGGDTSVFFTPKVGDQVVIGYVVGDVNEPMVLGYAHSRRLGQTPPPEVSPVQHAIVTDTFRVDLNEKVGERRLRLTNRSNGDFVEIDAEDQSIIVQATNSLTLRSKGLIDIQAPAVQINKRPLQVTKRAI
jgi:uncharacterized protein involved in type VI secretion and phage assembly